MSPKPKKDEDGRRFRLDWLGYLGFVGLLGFFWETLRPFRILTLLCLFFLFPYRKNLRFFFQIVCYALGQMVAVCRVRGRLPRPGRYSQKASLTLPFAGFWVVESGGVERKDSHSWNVFNQRYAYDFLVKDEEGKTHRHEGRVLEDYYSFGQAILSPADGLVMQTRDGIRDNPRLGSIDVQARTFQGNFIVIRHAQGEYIYLAHLKEGSLVVKPGDLVKRGQTIGRCGNSGHSTEPHLHFQVQDRGSFNSAIGLPVEFSAFVLQKGGQAHEVTSGYLTKGQVIKNKKT